LLSPEQLADQLDRADAPLIGDVRKAPAFDAATRAIAGALKLSPDTIPGSLRRRHANAAPLCIARTVLHDLADIVRGAGTGKRELMPHSPGLSGISLGLSVNFHEDHAMLDQWMVNYDAFCVWIKFARAGIHNAYPFKQS
jgi:hypothetical protein